MLNNDVDNQDKAVQRLTGGDVRTAARLITMVENNSVEAIGLMKRIYPFTGRAVVIGITGAGGAGKSSLINQLISRFRDLKKKVGVVAVDPSSPFSGGALLGDRVRFQRHTMDNGVYVRSIASRGYPGGLACATLDVVRIMEAMGNDVVIVETLGVGQDEIDIIHVAQTSLLVLTPGMGDDIQAMKAGVMEIADIIVLNKFDLDGAESCLRSLEASLSRSVKKEPGKWIPPVIPTISSCSQNQRIIGVDDLMKGIEAHQVFLKEGGNGEKARVKRIEHELGLIFKNEVERLVLAGLKGTNKRRKYIEAIMMRETDPYSVVEEVLEHLTNRHS
ncbi:MAG: methylmalonyl Co-A mutase-associated GTPase MeaB [Pseudomonadota bacterium]